jgi:hypothetical protein
VPTYLTHATVVELALVPPAVLYWLLNVAVTYLPALAG